MMNEPNDFRTDAFTQKAITNRHQLLTNGGYLPVSHELVRKRLPILRKTYGGGTARDCFVLFMYIASYTSGDMTNPLYMWSYPSNAQISEDTGIHRDRIKKLCDILEAEELIMVRRVPYKGHEKKVYLPFMPMQ